MKSLLGAGFVVVLGLLLLAVADAFRLQEQVAADLSSEQRQREDTERALGKAREPGRILNRAKDFLLSKSDNRNAVYRGAIDAARTDVTAALMELSTIPAFRQRISVLRTPYENFLNAAEELLTWNGERQASDGLDFIENTLARRLNALDDILRQWGDEDWEKYKARTALLAEQRSTREHRLFFLVTMAFVSNLLITSLALGYARHLEGENARKYNEATRARIDMEQLSLRLLTVQEDERKRLSRELHDGIGQTLTALKIEIGQANLSPKTAMASLVRAKELAEDAVRTVRDMMLILRPPLLDDLGLEPAIRWQAQDFTRRTGLPCEFSATNVHEHLPDAWKTCVYRIVQEALHNCHKHATPSRVQIEMRQEPERLLVEVRDDGPGCELDEKGKPLRSAGLGILGMKERAAMLGGTVSLLSAPGRGTTVRISLPLARIVPVGGAPAPSLEQPGKRRREVA